MRHKPESDMPQMINRQDQSPTQKPAQETPAVVKQTPKTNNEPREIPPVVIVGAGIIAVLFILFLYHTYVNPLYQPRVKPHIQAPLAGFPDVPPYNTKEWQDMYKAGKTTPISGMPRDPRFYQGTAPSAGNLK